MSTRNPKPSRALNACVTVVALGVFALLSRAILSISEDEVGLAPLVTEKLHESGVESAVTAVLLNFRGYDTLLEIAVLVLAVIGVLSMRATGSSKGISIVAPADPVMALMARVLVPVMVLASGYLLWAGEHAPGGAFQAGSVLGAAGVLLALSGYRRPEWMTDFRIRLAISIGFIVFLAVAVLPMFLGGTLLEYPYPYAGALMLVIETWLTLSIGVILASLFLSSAAPMQSEVEGGEEL